MLQVVLVTQTRFGKTDANRNPAWRDESSSGMIVIQKTKPINCKKNTIWIG